MMRKEYREQIIFHSPVQNNSDCAMLFIMAAMKVLNNETLAIFGEILENSAWVSIF